MLLLQLKNADVVVSAIGKPEYVQGEWLKPGAVVIDVGTNYIPGMLIHVWFTDCVTDLNSSFKTRPRSPASVLWATFILLPLLR